MKKIYLLLMIIIGGTIGILTFSLLNNNLESSVLNVDYERFDEPEQYGKYLKEITTKFGDSESGYPLNYNINELDKAKAKRKGLKLDSKFSVVWEERGPNNVGGRTRGLIIDPDDATHNTWYAGSATGGIWKSIDGGANWTNLTNDFPNLAANTLAMAASNTQVIYAGTGEYFAGGPKGNGIFKSIDKGDNWTQLTSTIDNDNFEYVNRIIIDPSDENIVIAATTSGIMKSIDGGTSWTKEYSNVSSIDDLVAEPGNFNIIYATERSAGVVKSTDSGDSWTASSEGIGNGARYEIDISPVNTAKIYVSANVSSSSSFVYRSVDYGVTWKRFEDKDGNNMNFMGGQGNYDNIITAHPYDEDVAYLGGVNLWKVDFSDPGTTSETVDPEVKKVTLVNTGSFLDFINFGGGYLAGGMELGTENDATDIVESDWVSVEIRFGPGMSQKAHRFTVGGVGAGVPASDYVYEDYVDVPFEVWDVTNNKQLMASFRDQEEDGKFDLEARDPADATIGREYLFVNAVDYSTTASHDIDQDAGHSYKQLYFFWPTLADNGTWDDANLPDSKIFVEYDTYELILGTTVNVSDAYDDYSGNNIYDQGAGMGGTEIPGLHPDHHNLIMIPINEATDSFLVINANDGGLGISFDSGVTFDQLSNNYATTQFYGAAKKPNTDEYIGGMQDNGTWRSPGGTVASATTDYLFQISGDGFECIWNNTDADKIIGGSQYNGFRRTLNGGEQWISATTGITDGPFISRLSTHLATPDNLYAIGGTGVYKSTDFGDSWNMVTIGEGWNARDDYVPSALNVEVSLANENIIWAGAAMNEINEWKIFVSTDQGESYNAVTEFAGADLSGFISGIATHPFEDSTAYLLFSFSEEPKILRTKDLGQTWEDISGFVGNTSSDNGFPDVVTNSLVVLPNDPNTLWVGTDIGLFESTDDGATWLYADNGIPAVSVYDMFVQDDQVVVATYGRGIWSATIEELNFVPQLTANYIGFQTIEAQISVGGTSDSIEIYLNDQYNSTLYNFTGSETVNIDINESGNYSVKLNSYKNINIFQSKKVNVNVSFAPVLSSIYRNLTSNNIYITSTLTEDYDSIIIYSNDIKYSSIASPSSGETTFIVEATESMTYNIYIDGYINGIGNTSNTLSLYLLIVGIDNNVVQNELNIYPNPSNGLININFGDENTNYQLELYTLSGVKVHSEFVKNSNQAIDLQKLNNGIYIVNINKEGKSYSTKIHIRK